MRRVLIVSLGMAAWIIGLFVALYAFDVGEIRPIPGAQLVDHVLLCDAPDCAGARTRALPYFSPMRYAAGTETRHLRASIERPAQQVGTQALYFPKFSDNLDVRINGQLVWENNLPRRLWNTPLLIPLAGALVEAKTLTIDIMLYGPPFEGLDLQPFYYGPQQLLTPYRAWRYFYGPGLAQFALGLMVVLATALLIVWSFRRDEKEYLWLGLACATATLLLTHYGYGASLGDYRLWPQIWLLCVSLYVLLILKFVRRFLGLDLTWPERIHTLLLAGLSTATLLSPRAMPLPCRSGATP